MRKIYRRVLLTVLVIAIALGVWAVNTVSVSSGCIRS